MWANQLDKLDKADSQVKLSRPAVDSNSCLVVDVIYSVCQQGVWVLEVNE